jgi:hypothetical protein
VKPLGQNRAECFILYQPGRQYHLVKLAPFPERTIERPVPEIDGIVERIANNNGECLPEPLIFGIGNGIRQGRDLSRVNERSEGR